MSITTWLQQNIPRIGVSWRHELALAIERWPHLGMVEVMAESIQPDRPLPTALRLLQDRGIPLIPHGTGLSLGSALPPNQRQLEHLARVAELTQAPLISEHLAFVRGGAMETGHLLPIPHTREMLDIVIENVKQAQAALPVPLALENISTLFQWPQDDIEEAVLLNDLLQKTDALLLVDLENVYANCLNFGGDPKDFLQNLPLNRIAYIHVAGGRFAADGRYHDTHTTPIPLPVLELVSWLCERVAVPGIILERDDHFPDEPTLHAELDNIRGSVRLLRAGHD